MSDDKQPEKSRPEKALSEAELNELLNLPIPGKFKRRAIADEDEPDEPVRVPRNLPSRFVEAEEHHALKEILPNDLSSAELARLDVAVRERSLALARVTNAAFLGRVDSEVGRIVAGQQTEEKARRELEAVLKEIGYEPDKPGSIEDLSSDQRLRLIIRVQAEQSFGYGQWRQGQSDAVLKVWPAQEFYRAADRKEPRNWPERWAAAGGQFFKGHSDYPQGRMVAMKDSPIWETINRFSVPYAPFDFNSGMDIRDIERAEAIELGLMRPGQIVVPQRRSFESDFGMAEPELEEALKDALVESLGTEWVFQNGELQQANEQIATMLRNDLFIGNIFARGVYV